MWILTACTTKLMNADAGVPLLEVVTEPDLRSGAEAAAYGAELRRIVTFLDISNGNMQVA